MSAMRSTNAQDLARAIAGFTGTMDSGINSDLDGQEYFIHPIGRTGITVRELRKGGPIVVFSSVCSFFIQDIVSVEFKQGSAHLWKSVPTFRERYGDCNLVKVEFAQAVQREGFYWTPLNTSHQPFYLSEFEVEFKFLDLPEKRSSQLSAYGAARAFFNYLSEIARENEQLMRDTPELKKLPPRAAPSEVLESQAMKDSLVVQHQRIVAATLIEGKSSSAAFGAGMATLLDNRF